MRTASLLILTVVFALILCGAVSAGTPLQQNQTGTVSGDLYVNTTDGWPSSTQGATNEVTQANTLPNYTSIDSAMIYVNVYSGSGTNNWPVRTTVKLDGNGDGDYDDAGELLGVEDMNIPGTTDGTVYWLNDHCNRVYSDYQVWYDVKNLITSNNPTLYVKTENMGGDGYDGRIKLLALCVAYNDGDQDKVHYYVLNGQDWINAASSPSTSTFNTSGFNGQVSSATLNMVALSGTDGTYTLNGNSLSGNLTETGSYYKEHIWDVTGNITSGADTNLTYTNVGSSLKMNFATLTLREAATPPVADFAATPTSGVSPLNVSFTSTSTGTITDYTWDFDNNGTIDSTDANPTWTYNSRGTYTVTLTVTGPGGTDTETKTNLINVTGAKIWDVYPTDPQGTVNTIQGSAVSGDIIYFHAGTYSFSSGPLYGLAQDLKGGIIYKGEGNGVTFINVDQQVYLKQSNICLDGFTLQNISVLQNTGSNIMIKNCIFTGFSGTIYIGSGPVTFENDTFLNGTSKAPVINTDASTTFTVHNCKFSNNKGQCILLKGKNSIIMNNVFDSNAVAIRFTKVSGANAFYLNTFTNNTSLITYSGTVVTQNFTSPTPILYSYNGTTYYGYMGNYWSDYAGRDENGDGIGDTPYTEPNGFRIDNYPLIAPVSQYNFDAVQANFTATPTSGVVPLQVQFNDTSIGTITGYAWDFNNDGVVDSTLQNPTGPTQLQVITLLN